MKTTTLNGIHNFEKQNLVIVTKNKQHYDIYKCSKCGIKGKRFSFTDEIVLDGRTSQNKIKNCDGNKNECKRIRITYCSANGDAFKNITPNSEHVIIDPPEEYSDAKYANGVRGYWIQGVGEPVLILFEELEILN